LSSWDPETRVANIGGAELQISPGVAVKALSNQSVTVSGYRSKHDRGPRLVTEIRSIRPGL
jgi:hypothetical protein